MLAYTNNPYKTRCSSPTYNPTTQPGCSMISGSRCGFLRRGVTPGEKIFPSFLLVTPFPNLISLHQMFTCISSRIMEMLQNHMGHPYILEGIHVRFLLSRFSFCHPSCWSEGPPLQGNGWPCLMLVLGISCWHVLWGRTIRHYDSTPLNF